MKGRPSSVNSSTVPRKVIKKKHNNPKQIFILSRDALQERKGRSALTILMVLVGGALMVAINGMSEGSAAFTNKQLVSLAPNVIFVSPGSKSKTFQEAPGLATQAPRLTFNGEVANTIKSLPYVKDVVPGYTAQVQLNIEGNIENTNVFAAEATAAFTIAPSLTLVPGSSVQNNNPSAMLVGYNIANPPGYTHNPLIRVGQSITATYDGTSRHFLVTGVLNEAGNPNVDQVVIINTNTGNTFFHRLGQYDQMFVFARSGNDVPTVIQEMDRVYGSDSFGIVSPAAIMQAQKHTQAGGASFTLEVGFIAMLVSAIGVVTTLYTSVNERRKEIGTMKAIGAKPMFIMSMFLSDAVLIGFIGASLGIVSGIGLAYLLSASGASGGGAYIAPIFLPNELLQVWLLSLTVTLLAGLFPAWKASRLSPLIAMRV
ncbi:MAG TPA: ABC transporter permease [Candidatus Eisenbacteria bacterium]|nr:ABC transporter permease [Candidatus Eisenbacteria bacterium]